MSQLDGPWGQGPGDFAFAIQRIKEGKRVARQGWNGKGMWIELVSHWTPQASTPQGNSVPVLPFVGMVTATQELVPWLCSQTDMLADDWVVVS